MDVTHCGNWGEMAKKRHKLLEEVTLAIKWSHWTGKAEAWIWQELPSTCWVPGAGGPVVSRTVPLASGSLCLVEGGRQLTSTRVSVVFQMEAVVSALERNKARKAARSAWGRGRGLPRLGTVRAET